MKNEKNCGLSLYCSQGLLGYLPLHQDTLTKHNQTVAHTQSLHRMRPRPGLVGTPLPTTLGSQTQSNSRYDPLSQTEQDGCLPCSRGGKLGSHKGNLALFSTGGGGLFKQMLQNVTIFPQNNWVSFYELEIIQKIFWCCKNPR